MRSPHRTHCDGTALILALGYLTIMTLLASSFLAALRMRMNEHRLNEKHTVALYIAEAGVHAAMAKLQSDSSDYTGEENTTLGEGRFSVQVKPGDASHEFVIVSTGELVAAKRGVYRMRIDARVSIGEKATEIRQWKVRKLRSTNPT